MPVPNNNTFAGPVALLPPDVLHNSWQTYQPLDDKPLAGKIAWSLAPGLLSAWIEVIDGRSAEGDVTSAPQRYIYGLGDSGPAPGKSGTQDHPVHLGPYVVASKTYTKYLVVLTTKLHWTDQWGNDQVADGLNYDAFIVS